MNNAIPWKVLATVSAVTSISIAALAAGQNEIALLAAGALIGYLGKVNGAKSSPRNGG